MFSENGLIKNLTMDSSDDFEDDPFNYQSHHNYHIKIIFEMESLAMLAQVCPAFKLPSTAVTRKVYWHI